MTETDNKTYESIKEKLRKLLALAKGGYAGEAETARRMLEKLCEQYGVSMEDLLDSDKVGRYCFNVGRSKIFLKLFVQCYSSVTGEKTMRYGKLSGSEIVIDLTAFQAAELGNLFFWHKTNLKKDLEDTLKIVFEAYIDKHGIQRLRGDDEEDEPLDLSKIDIEHIRKILYMKQTLNDNQYRKMIGKQ